MNYTRNSLNRAEAVALALILGLGAAFLFVGWQSAGQAADLARCRSNLHQIGAAAHRYANDNGGAIPSNGAHGWGTYVADGRSFGVVVSAGRGGRGTEDYLDGVHSLFCPSLSDEVYAVSGYARPDEIDEENPIVRMGYMWVYYPESSSQSRSNSTLFDDPHHAIAFDLGWDGFPSPFSIPSHQDRLQVLHLGGHVTSVSLDEANAQENSPTFYDWMSEQSRNGLTEWPGYEHQHF